MKERNKRPRRRSQQSHLADLNTRIFGPPGEGGDVDTGRGRRRRRGFQLAAIVSATLLLGLLAALPAQAVHDTGSFELDGNAVNGPAPGDDWDNVCHQVTHTDCSTTNDTTGATAVDWVAEPNPNATIFTGGGSKDPQDINQWAWKDAGGLPDKDNLLHSFAARYPTTSEGDVLFFGSDRFDNSGDAQQGFWFFQNSIGLGNNSIGGGSGFTGVHMNGDLLVISDFSVGGTTSTITVYKWDSTCKKTTGSTAGSCGDANLRILQTSGAANCATAAPNDAFCGLVNPTNGTTAPWPYTDKSGNHSYLQGEFYEGGVNLTTLGLANLCFASVASETRSSTSTTATLKDFILGNFGHCGSTTTTQSSVTGSTSIGTGSVSVSDSATVSVSGFSTWHGTVQFHLRGPIGSALETSTDIGGPVAVSNSTPTVQSATATVTAAGDYCWSAHFTSQTTGVGDSNDDGTNECFTVTPVTPALPTTAGPDVVLGNPVTDTAALSGTSNQPGTPAINPSTAGAPAGGTITFTLVKDDCTTLATGTGTNPQSVPVSGDGTYGPVSFTPDAGGTYHWKATYTPAAGDPNNLASTFNGDCSDTNETVVVTSVASSMTSAQSFIPNDSATISAPAGGNLAGSVSFDVYESADCSGTAIYHQDVAVSGASPKTVHTTNTTVSTTAANVSWNVSYDSTNPAQQDIGPHCFEKTALSIDNDGTISSGP
jgi:hypothetical protein